MQLKSSIEERASRRWVVRGVVWAAAIGTLACGGDDSSSGTSSGKTVEASAEAVTWSKDIAPLIADKCVGCHTQNGIAPFSMDSYEKAKPFAALMAKAVEDGRMPPFLAQETDACKPRLPWANDLRLKPEQKQMLRAWADADAPEGEVASAVKVTSKLSGTLQREDVAMPIPEAISVAGAKDLHTCVIVDPGLKEDSYVVGRFITAGNAAVLHHVVSYVITPGKNDDGSDQSKAQLAAAVMAEKGVGPGGRYDCFGGPALNTVSTEMLDAWAPGGIPNLAPPDSGQPIDKDSLVLLDMHYHPTGGGEQVDTGTKLSLMLTTEKPAYVSKVILLGNFDQRRETPYGVGDIVKQPDEDVAAFTIPANAKDHVEEVTWQWKLPAGNELQVYTMGTHMHFVGRDMRITLDHAAPKDGEPDSECLIETPAWDFNWQRGYAYDAPRESLPTFRDGDLLHMRCVYDNTLGNQFVAQALTARGLDAPIDVNLGEDTLDEMCLGALGIMYPNAQ
jgi:hypothetical protein